MSRARRALVALGFVAAFVATLATRVVLEGRDALARGDAAITERRVADAVAAWESAARWYLPGAPHVSDAYDRLAALAVAEPAAALPAWRAVRSAAIASAGLWQPHADHLATANARIAALSAAHPEGAIPAGTEPAERLAWYTARLAVPTRPIGFTLALAVLGIAAWLGGIAWIACRGVDASGRWLRQPLLAGAAVTVVGLVAWAAGLYSV